MIVPDVIVSLGQAAAIFAPCFAGSNTAIHFLAPPETTTRMSLVNEVASYRNRVSWRQSWHVLFRHCTNGLSNDERSVRFCSASRR